MTEAEWDPDELWNDLDNAVARLIAAGRSAKEIRDAVADSIHDATEDPFARTAPPKPKSNTRSRG